MTKPLIALATFTLVAFTLAVPLSAASAKAAPVGVRVDDLDLDTPAGKAKLDSRIEAAARIMCSDVIETGTRLAQLDCHQQVRKEVLERIAERNSRLEKGG